MRILSILVIAMACSVCAEDKAAAGAERARGGPSETRRVVRQEDSKGRITELAYLNDNLISKTINVGTKQEAKWLYTYNEHRQLVAEHAPDGSRTLYFFDKPTDKKPSQSRIFGPDGIEKPHV